VPFYSKLLKFSINQERPTFVLSRPNELDGGKGLRIDTIVQYEKTEYKPDFSS